MSNKIEYRYEVFKKSGKFYWACRSAKGDCRCTSTGYKVKASAAYAAKRFINNMKPGVASYKDLTDTAKPRKDA